MNAVVLSEGGNGGKEPILPWNGYNPEKHENPTPTILMKKWPYDEPY